MSFCSLGAARCAITGCRHGNADLRSAQPAAGGRTGRTPISRMASLSAWTPAAQVARRHGNAPTSGQFSRWGPAQPAAGERRDGLRPPGWPPSRRGPQQRRWRAGKGTLRSAQPAAGGRTGRTPTPRMAPLSAWTPAAQVARRQGNADLRSAQPAAGGRTGRTSISRMASLSARTPGAQVARRQGNADLRSAQPAVGGRMRRTPPPRMAFLSAWTPAAQVARRHGNAPTSGRSAPSASPNPDPKRAHSRNSPLPKTPYLPSPRTSSVRKSSCLPTAQKFVSLDSGARHSPP